MTWEEREILTYLKTSPKIFFSLREISRRAAGKKTFERTPNWAKPFLPRMVEKGLVEKDSAGHFRYHNQAEVKAKGRKWVSPQIARVLKRSDKDFSEVATLEISEEDVQEAESQAKVKVEVETGALDKATGRSLPIDRDD